MVANCGKSPRLSGNLESNSCVAAHTHWYNHCFVPDSTTKRIICLANSGKHSSRCVAGKEITGSRSWIRPVSGHGRGEVSLEERLCEDGSEPQLLDVIDIPLVEARPDGCQQENWLLDPSCRWVRVERFPESDLDQLLDLGKSLWIDETSAKRGLSDRVLQSQEHKFQTSLRFIRVGELVLSVANSGYKGSRQVRGRFRYAGESYDLAVTDPPVKDSYLYKSLGVYPYGPAYMTISLPGLLPSRRARYKLIAAIIPAGGSLA